MIGILSNTTDPAFNLATEEYLLRHTTDNVFFLYVNKPSIIVGKHQNTFAEINFEFVNRKNIAVHRRLSGGGTVYHDLQNLNFCFIKSGEKSNLVNFALYSKPIIEALNGLGIQADFGKRHDIQINKKKISGNASHVFKNRVMHHGTLLFKSDLRVLNQALKTNPLSFKDKAVKSVRSEVCNISDHIDSIDFESFKDYIFKYLLNYFDGATSDKLSGNAIDWINKAVTEKYTTDNWNYGYSPNYSFKKRITLKDGQRLSSIINVKKGVINECKISVNSKEWENLFLKVSKSILGLNHSKIALQSAFNGNSELRAIELTEKNWISLFFS